MSTPHHNIYITLTKMLYGYARGVYYTIQDLCGKKESNQPLISPILHEITSKGPVSFWRNPTAIRLGRALFAPLILISHLYDKK